MMMVRIVTLFALIVIVAAYNKKNILKENKTPKNILFPKTNSFNGTCDECKMLVSRFAKAMKDPQKISELKDLLQILCHEVPYKAECHLLVDQLDYIIKKLEPYLKNPEKVCRELRVCSNRKIENFHRINTIYGRKNVDEDSARELICEECQFAADELKRAIENEKTKQQLKRFISETICSHLGNLKGKCDLMLEEFLPELFEEIDKLLENKKAFCVDIGLCKRLVEPMNVSEDNESSLQKTNDSNASWMENIFGISENEIPTGNIQKSENMQACEACREALYKMKALLVNSAFQQVLENIFQHKFCQILSYERNLCENLTMNYMPKFLSWTVVYLNQHDVCKSLGACKYKI